MEWIKYRVSVSCAKYIDIIYGILLDYGITGIEIESNDYLKLNQEEKDWDYYDEPQNKEHIITYYLPSDCYGQPDAIINRVKEFAEKEGFNVQINQEKIKEEQWTEEWKKYFKPVKITENIVVKPEWEYYEKTNEIIIEINPGMAFGTGTHETTAMCITLLEEYLDSDSEVLDIGCGSGILSIAAAKLGASKVTGIDIDQTAVEVSKENVEKNNLSDKIHIMYGDLTKGVDTKVDIAVVNILAEIIISLSDYISKNLKGKKLLIASGILREKENLVIKALIKNGFEILQVKQKGEWSAVAARLKV